MAELESTKQCLDRATCKLTLTTDFHPIPHRGRGVLETTLRVAVGPRDGRQLIQRRRLLPAQAPPLAIGVIDLLARCSDDSICVPCRARPPPERGGDQSPEALPEEIEKRFTLRF